MTTVPHTSYVLFHCIISISSLFKHFLQFLKDGCSLLYQLLLLLYLCFKGVDFFLKDSNKRRLIAAMDSFLIRDFIFEKVNLFQKSMVCNQKAGWSKTYSSNHLDLLKKLECILAQEQSFVFFNIIVLILHHFQLQPLKCSIFPFEQRAHAEQTLSELRVHAEQNLVSAYEP